MKKIVLASLVAAAIGAVALPAAAAVIVEVAPPPLRYEVVPAARPGYLWIPGSWEWRGKRHHWVAGRWIRHRPGYVYAPARWEERNGRYHYIAPAWSRHDRDGDGVPNRLDRAPDNPYRR